MRVGNREGKDVETNVEGKRNEIDHKSMSVAPNRLVLGSVILSSRRTCPGTERETVVGCLLDLSRTRGYLTLLAIE